VGESGEQTHVYCWPKGWARRDTLPNWLRGVTFDDWLITSRNAVALSVNEAQGVSKEILEVADLIAVGAGFLG
jgi:hypothetical protein